MSEFVTMLFTLSPYAYTTVVIVIGVVTALSINRRVRQLQRERKDYVQQIDQFESVETETPHPHPRRVARRRGIRSIDTRYRFIRGGVFIFILLIVLLLVSVPLLEAMPAAYVSIIAGLVTLIVGIAARPFIENLIAGVVISLGQSIRIGDTVLIDGHYGTVEKLTLTYTILKVWDWRRYIIPNQRLLQKEFENLSLVDSYQWAYVEFWVEPNADLDWLEKEVLSTIRQCPSFQNYEDPAFWVMGLEREAIKCWAAAWATSPPEGWNLKSEMRQGISALLKEKGLRTHIHHYSGLGTAAASQVGE